MDNVISLDEYKVKVVEKLFKEAIEDGDYKFCHVNDEFLNEHAKSGEVNIENLLKTVWMLAESMDKLEIEFLKFKLDIVNLLNGR